MNKANKAGLQDFARCYDEFYDHLDYDRWIEYNECIAKRAGWKGELVLDLACGTGNSTFPWVEKGYWVVGIDISEAMLRQAQQKARQRGQQKTPIFLQMDMGVLGFGEKTFDLVTAVFDSLNFLLMLEEVEEACRQVYRVLRPGGMFIFDAIGESRLHYPQNYTQRWELRSGTLVWQQHVDVEERLFEGTIDLHVLQDGESVYTECFQEKLYFMHELQGALSRADFSSIRTYRTNTLRKADRNAKRISFLAEKGE